MKNTEFWYRDAAVIIPAYRESDNLRVLLPRLLKTLPGASIVIVDDSEEPESERTAAVARGTQYRNIDIVRRGAKGGRGSAVFEGLEYALKKSYIRYFLEMDADLAHAPEECRDLIDAAAQSDMVIGSRYLRESVIEDWPMQRLVQSRVINFFLRYLLGLHITDFTNGFRLYTRPVVEFLVKTPMREKGFIALSEIAYKVERHGFRISEIPVSFKDRKFGRSNVNIHELFMSLIGAFRIRSTSFLDSDTVK